MFAFLHQAYKFMVGDSTKVLFSTIYLGPRTAHSPQCILLNFALVLFSASSFYMSLVLFLFKISLIPKCEMKAQLRRK